MNPAIEKFIQGTRYVRVVAPVTADNLTKPQEPEDTYRAMDCIKFIPASGAATRMFKDLYQYLEDGEDTAFIENFFNHLEDFAFYGDLKAFMEAKGLDKKTPEGKAAIIRWLLEDGLAYGALPKALLKVHRHDGSALTLIDAHIYEGEQYLGETGKLHFTISESHESLFKTYVKTALKGHDGIHVTHSFQKKSTDTLAVDMGNAPFLKEDGEMLYRAGGHGALIENLNDLDGDIIFIKNVDNACHQDHMADTIHAKKMLAATGLKVKAQIDDHMRALKAGTEDMAAIEGFIEETLNIGYDGSLTKDRAMAFLNRPLRVCGMVRNQGEPGGGPFVVDNGDYRDLQICEKSEIHMADERQRDIFKQSQFFNPVDLVCFVKDWEGHKFNLLDFIHEDRYFISEKSYKGRPLKALEHPGLWNGAMHHWNTLFVEVPLSTFTPIKTVNDLLRDGHQGAKS